MESAVSQLLLTDFSPVWSAMKICSLFNIAKENYNEKLQRCLEGLGPWQKVYVYKEVVKAS